MRKQKIDEEELFKEIHKLCITCVKECKQYKNAKIYKCFYQPKEGAKSEV